MEKTAKKARKLSILELLVYIVCGLLALWGLTYIVLGLLAEYLNVLSKNNPLLKASDVIKEHFGLGFFGWGLIIISIGAVLAVIVLCLNAKKSDREYEREARRAARRNRLDQELGSLNLKEVVDAEAKPAEEPQEELKVEDAKIVVEEQPQPSEEPKEE